jgi:hypothetical protein
MGAKNAEILEWSEWMQRCAVTACWLLLCYLGNCGQCDVQCGSEITCWASSSVAAADVRRARCVLYIWLANGNLSVEDENGDRERPWSDGVLSRFP